MVENKIPKVSYLLVREVETEKEGMDLSPCLMTAIVGPGGEGEASASQDSDLLRWPFSPL